MRRDDALKKLMKRFGPKFAYRINDKAPTADERQAATAQLKDARDAVTAANGAAAARLDFLKANDAEYQRLIGFTRDARTKLDTLHGISGHYKITVGTANSLFFTVEAQGDSWEDIFRKLAEKDAKDAERRKAAV